MTAELLQALCALGAAGSFWVLVWALRAAHRVPPPYDGRGWR